MIISPSSQLYEAFSHKLVTKLKLFDNSIEIPKVPSGHDERSNDFSEKETIISFSDQNNVYRKIKDIKFDDKRFRINASILSYHPSSHLVQGYCEKCHKRYIMNFLCLA